MVPYSLSVYGMLLHYKLYLRCIVMHPTNSSLLTKYVTDNINNYDTKEKKTTCLIHLQKSSQILFII